MTSFCTCINSIKNLSLFTRVITSFLIAFAPVWIFNNNLYIWIYFFSRAKYKVARNLHHFSKTEFFPGTIAFFADTILAHTLCKEKIINNKFIKHRGCIFRNFFCKFAHWFITVAYCIEQALSFFVGLILVRANCCNTSRNFNIIFLHNALYEFKLFLF